MTHVEQEQGATQLDDIQRRIEQKEIDMSLRTISIDQAATQLHPAVLAEAKGHPTADTAHPNAYCKQYVGMYGEKKVVNLSAGGPVCPKGFSLLGHISDATRVKLLASGTTPHTSDVADRMLTGGLQVQKAGSDALTMLLLVTAAIVFWPITLIVLLASLFTSAVNSCSGGGGLGAT